MKVLHGKRPIETILSLVFFFHCFDLSLKSKCGDTRINEKSISTFQKWKSKHMELTLISMFERFWVPPASSKYWNYQHSNRLLWLWKCYFKSAKNCKTFNHPAKMCGRNQEIKLAIKILVGSWDEEFKWTLMVLGEGHRRWTILYSHISQCSRSNQSTGQYKCFPGELSTCFYTSLPLRSSNE